MKFALSAFLLATSAYAKQSPPVPALIDFSKQEGNLRGRELQDASCTPSIEVSVTSAGGCFALGQEITVTVTTCPTPFAEWVGVFPEGDTEFDASNNWSYCCGDQDCEDPVEPGTYTLTFGASTAGSTEWPLEESFGGGTSYEIYFHTGYGSISSSVSITITPGYFCEGPFAGLEPDEIPCSEVPDGLPCLESDDEDGDEDGDEEEDEEEDEDGDGDEDEEPCEKITPGQGGTPPGQGGIPPGLQCKDFIPPGIAKKLTTGNAP